MPLGGGRELQILYEDVEYAREPQQDLIRWSRIWIALIRFDDNVGLISFIQESNEPKTFQEPKIDKAWMSAMEIEYRSIIKNDIWELVKFLKWQNVIGTK